MEDGALLSIVYIWSSNGKEKVLPNFTMTQGGSWMEELLVHYSYCKGSLLWIVLVMPSQV
jgi:hypothetical protein